MNEYRRDVGGGAKMSRSEVMTMFASLQAFDPRAELATSGQSPDTVVPAK
jgi:hypothetical protein